MRYRSYGKILIGAIATTIIVILSFVALSTYFVGSNVGSNNYPPAATQNSNSPALAVGASVATATPPPTRAVVPTTTSGLTIPTPSVAVGDIIPLPAALADHQNLTLRRPATNPQLSAQDAMRLVTAPWGMGGDYKGKKVTITATYGLATLGSRGADGKWVGGPRNLTIAGQVLDYIENRPMWILDYANTEFIVGGCPAPCPPPPTYTHTVYAIDEQTKILVFGWFYE